LFDLASQLVHYIPELQREGHAMLPLSTVQEVDRLLKEGTLSQRAIAAKLGVSRSTVGAIANGTRHIAASRTSRVAISQPQRCRECGHRVYVPCLICEARRYQHDRAKNFGGRRAEKRQL
jgi:hypothetical protein